MSIKKITDDFPSLAGAGAYLFGYRRWDRLLFLEIIFTNRFTFTCSSTSNIFQSFFFSVGIITNYTYLQITMILFVNKFGSATIGENF